MKYLGLDAEEFVMSMAIMQPIPQERSASPQPGNDAIPQYDTPKEEDLHVELEGEPNPAEDASNPVRLSMAELFDGRTPEQLEKSVEKSV